jgi:hypothetical protein
MGDSRGRLLSADSMTDAIQVFYGAPQSETAKRNIAPKG